MASICEDANEPSNSIEGKIFLDCLSFSIKILPYEGTQLPFEYEPYFKRSPNLTLLFFIRTAHRVQIVYKI
jgi:hypothetical protein